MTSQEDLSPFKRHVRIRGASSGSPAAILGFLGRFRISASRDNVPPIPHKRLLQNCLFATSRHQMK